MSLQKKFFCWSTIFSALLLLTGIFSIINLYSLWGTSRLTAGEYDAMDRAQATAVQVAWLRDALRGRDAAAYRDVRYFAPIQLQVLEITRDLRTAATLEDGDGAAEKTLGQSASEHLSAALQDSSSQLAGGESVKTDAVAAAAELEKLRQALDDVSKLMPESARHHVTAASGRLLNRLEWSCFLLLVVLILSMLIHFNQYRALVRPLLWLRDDMRRSASNGYLELARVQGAGEFKAVARYFNGLARELAELYRGLEQKVIDRSRELVRSERLASVGFLAAGVAHEINNPLSVISGYAELAAKSLRSLLLATGGGRAADPQAEASEAETLVRALEAQEIIQEEAFRCKEITGRLLSLSRGGGGGRQPLRIDEVVRQVAVLTKGLRNYRDRRVILDFKADEALQVVGNPTEMKQVLLNLTVNALEAAPPDEGEVRIAGRRSGDWVELCVQDNGKGMSAETLERVFEPFFTAKRGSGEPGTGLGLSITHAIVESHGGRIRAESDGPGRGSRFTLRLPATAKAPVGAAKFAMV